MSLKLFVWSGRNHRELSDYGYGLYVAIADNEDEAKQVLFHERVNNNIQNFKNNRDLILKQGIDCDGIIQVGDPCYETRKRLVERTEKEIIDNATRDAKISLDFYSMASLKPRMYNLEDGVKLAFYENPSC